MLAALSEGHADLADALFLTAFIIFTVIFVLKMWVWSPPDGAMAGRLDLAAAGLACLSLAWFVL